MKKFLQILITSATAYLVVLYAFAAPVTTFSPNLLPISNDTYDLGTSSPQARWLTIYAQNASTTNLTAFGRLLVGGTATTTIYGNSATYTFSGGITLSGGCFKDLSGSCLSSSAGITSLNGLTGATQTFANNGYLDITSAGTIHTFNGTTSPFFGTLFASSTIRFSSLTSGQLNSNSGLIYSGATTTFSGGLNYSNGNVTPDCVTITGGAGLCDGVDNTGGGGGSGTVGTSTNEISGRLAYWTSNSATPALLGMVATTSATCSSPLSCGAFDVLTGGGAISISQSNGGTNGYLSSTDWTLFNNKV